MPDGTDITNTYDAGGHSGQWQVRWGVKDVGQVPSQFKGLEAPPNQYDPNSWLYFDRYGVPKFWRSPDVHELFTVDVTYETMLSVFGHR